MNKRLVFLILLQMFLLLSIVGKYHYIAATGTVVTLKTEPVDPRDLFYGDYVILHYDISEIERDAVDTDLKEERQGPFPVYVLVEKKQNPWYEAVGVYERKPEPKPNQAVLRAKLYSFFPKQDSFYLKYGIERYYVPENAGRAIEQRRDQLNLVDVRVSASGDAVIERLRYTD
jgi:uncharacterized membrane-anchored protein